MINPELTFVLARIFGVFFIILGLLVFANRKAFVLSVGSMFKEQFAEFLTALVTIMGGLILVNIYQNWTSLPGVVLSLTGWATLLKGLLIAFVPAKKLGSYMKTVNRPAWYTVDGIIALVLGIYLSGVGFGLW